MSLTLTYNNDLSRVQIAATDLPDVDAVTIERSTNQLYWETVRGGAAVPVVGGTASLDDFEFSADVPNYYRVRTGLGAGLYLPGTAGSYASTPDHASLDITGDIDLRVDADLTSWANGALQALVAKYTTTGSQRSWRLRMTADGVLGLQWTTGGGLPLLTMDTSIPVPVASGPLVLRETLDVDNGASQRVGQSWTAAAMAGPWVQLGSTVTTSGATSMHSGSSALEVGSTGGGTNDLAEGVVRAVEARSGIDGTVVADPDFTIHDTDTTSFVDSTGKTWTIHGDARILADPIFTDSITPSIEGRTWLKSIKHPFLNRPYSVGGVDDDATDSRDVVYDVQGRSVGVAVTDVRSGGRFTITLRTATPTESRDLDLTIRAGGTFFIQPPAGSQIPGGYVAITGTAAMERFGPVSTRRRWPLPCKVVAAPAPAVVGGTMTYRALMNLYGSYATMLAANASYADLLALMASPDDLVVL